MKVKGSLHAIGGGIEKKLTKFLKLTPNGNGGTGGISGELCTFSFKDGYGNPVGPQWYFWPQILFYQGGRYEAGGATFAFQNNLSGVMITLNEPLKSEQWVVTGYNNGSYSPFAAHLDFFFDDGTKETIQAVNGGGQIVCKFVAEPKSKRKVTSVFITSPGTVYMSYLGLYALHKDGDLDFEQIPGTEVF